MRQERMRRTPPTRRRREPEDTLQVAGGPGSGGEAEPETTDVLLERIQRVLDAAGSS